MRRPLGLAFASLFTVAARADLITGPVSPYYLSDLFDGSRIYVVQGLSVILSFPTAYGQGEFEGALAVSDVSIRTRGSDLRFVRDLGAGEYTLNGVPTGVGYATPPTGNLRYYDGTSSGASSLFVDHGQYDPASGGVYIADYYWQNPQLLFYPAGICNNSPPSQPGCAGLSGIAFDPINDSLWVSAKGSPIVQEYSFGGTLLASFNAQDPFHPGYNAALGVDPADHTLWTTTGGSNFLRQYSLAPFTLGVQLQSGTPNGLPPGFYESADFQQQVPEPTSFLLVTTGIAALFRFRRHHLPRSPMALSFGFGGGLDRNSG